MTGAGWLLAALTLATTVRALPAAAGLPDPYYSTVDRVLVVCPEGDAVFRVTLRDAANNVEPGYTVMLAFGACPSFALCPGLPGSPTPYQIDRANQTITRTTNLQSVAEFPIRMGGTCPDSLVTIYAEGINFGRRSLVSPDQNGDGVVDGADLGLLRAKVGTTDLTGDFDGDRIVTAADVAMLQAHLGHSCNAATPAVRNTWGRLKLLYR